MCSQHYSCVCWCMSVEEARAENVRFLYIYFIFIVILNYPLESMCQKQNFHFYALYIDE